MAEIELVVFATYTLQVFKAVIPVYRSRFSMHFFSQPQLVPILCLMCYDERAFCEAEISLAKD